MLVSSGSCPLALQAGAGATVSPAASLVSPERGSQGLLGQSLQQMPPSNCFAPAVAPQLADMARLERTSISEGASPSGTANLLWSQDQAAGGGVPAPAPAPRQQPALAAVLLRSPSMAAFATPPPCKLGSLQEFVTSEVRPGAQHHEVCMILYCLCRCGHAASLGSLQEAVMPEVRPACSCLLDSCVVGQGAIPASRTASAWAMTVADHAGGRFPAGQRAGVGHFQYEARLFKVPDRAH